MGLVSLSFFCLVCSYGDVSGDYVGFDTLLVCDPYTMDSENTGQYPLHWPQKHSQTNLCLLPRLGLRPPHFPTTSSPPLTSLNVGCQMSRSPTSNVRLRSPRHTPCQTPPAKRHPPPHLTHVRDSTPRLKVGSAFGEYENWAKWIMGKV